MNNCAGKNWRAYQATLKDLDPRPRHHKYAPRTPGGSCLVCGETEHAHRGLIWRAAFWLRQ